MSSEPTGEAPSTNSSASDDAEKCSGSDPVSSAAEMLEEVKLKLTKAEKKAKYRSDYPEPIKSRREELKLAHSSSKTPEEIIEMFHGYWEADYKEGLNIYGSVVTHFRAMPDRSVNSVSISNLAGLCLKSFRRWMENRDDEEELTKRWLTRDIKIQAIESCGGKASCFMDLFKDSFDLDPAEFSKEISAEIREKMGKHNFKDAAELIMLNGMRDKYSFEDIVVPLLMQDKQVVAHEYIKGMPELQKQLVRFYDQFVGQKCELGVQPKLQKYKDEGIMTIQFERFTDKTIEKTINNFLQKICIQEGFEEDLDEYATNFRYNRAEKTLKHDIQCRYDPVAKTRTTDDVYFQQLKGPLSQNDRLANSIIFFLWTSNLYEKRVDALCWVQYLNAGPSHPAVPGCVRDFLEKSKTQKERDMVNDASDLLEKRRMSAVHQSGEVFYVFEKEKKGRIRMVLNDADLEMLSTTLKYYEKESDDKWVGVDTEWIPTHLIKPTSSKIAIMQIYIGDDVYIVDFVALEHDTTIREQTWTKFAKRLLCSSLIIIGFDLKNDLDAFLALKALKGMIPQDSITNVLCLKRLTENICEVDMQILGLEKNTFKLADLSEIFCGIKLNKTEQCSNWYARPLRRDQITYAAMDAFIVVDVFKRILNKVKERADVNIEIEQLLKESNVLAPKKEKTSKKEKRKVATMTWNELLEMLKDCRDYSKPLKKPHEIKMIVDSMLLGLGKHLRRCGIDVIVPRTQPEFLEKLKSMKNVGEMRWILTTPGKSYAALSIHYPDYLISLNDITTKKSTDQLQMVFQKFNIELERKLLFTRCSECNSRCLVRFPAPVLHMLHSYLVSFVQNVYRSDMSQFPIDEWFEKLNNLDAASYDGLKVEISRPDEESDWIVATTEDGCLHITRNLVLHNNRDDGVDVRIQKVESETFNREGLVFYVCGDCGKVFWDGRNVESPSTEVSEKSTASPSVSQESVSDEK